MNKWLGLAVLSLWGVVSFASAQTGGTPFPSTGGPSVTVSQAGPVTVKFTFGEVNQAGGFEGNSSIGVSGGVSGDGPATLYVVDAANNVISSVNLSVTASADNSGNKTSTTTVSGTGAGISMPGYSSGSTSGTANIDLSGNTPSGTPCAWDFQSHSNTALGVTTTTSLLIGKAACTYTFYAPAKGSYTVYVIDQVDTDENDFWSTDKDVWIPVTVTQSTSIQVSAVTAAPAALPTGSISVNKNSNGAGGVTLNWSITPPQ